MKANMEQRIAYIEKQIKTWPEWKQSVGSYSCKDSTLSTRVNTNDKSTQIIQKGKTK